MRAHDLYQEKVVICHTVFISGVVYVRYMFEYYSFLNDTGCLVVNRSLSFFFISPAGFIVFMGVLFMFCERPSSEAVAPSVPRKKKCDCR